MLQYVVAYHLYTPLICDTCCVQEGANTSPTLFLMTSVMVQHICEGTKHMLCLAHRNMSKYNAYVRVQNICCALHIDICCASHDKCSFNLHNVLFGSYGSLIYLSFHVLSTTCALCTSYPHYTLCFKDGNYY